MPVQRYLIGSGTGASASDVSEVAEVLKRDRNVKVIKMLGPESSPNIVVAEMTPQKADKLKKRFAGRFIIEPDAPLTPF
jgi:homoaconitase/3-isopropylmalate dehydratase large subunit